MMVIIDNLVKNYGGFRLNVSMEIPNGTVTGIIGKNGAGKTTIIKAILGLIRPDEGHVTINGKETSCLSSADKAGIGVALSDSGFNRFFDLKDVICILRKMYPTFDEDFFRKNCAAQGLAIDKKLKDYSTGMHAKLRVLVAHGENIDEPSSWGPPVRYAAEGNATNAMAAAVELGASVGPRSPAE